MAKEKRKGTQIYKATAPKKTKKTGAEGTVGGGSGVTRNPKPVSKAKAQKAFKGSDKNFQKAYSAYIKTFRKRRRAQRGKSTDV